MPAKTRADCRHSRRINGAMRCEEQRSNAIDDVIILDVEQAKRAARFGPICTRVAARCAFCQSVA
jgi:hypothetical protein